MAFWTYDALRRTMLRPTARPTVMKRIARTQKSAVFVRSGYVKLGEPGAGEEHPDADRDQVEHADDVVGRRVIRSLLVAVVEAVELRRDDPGGQADEEEDEQLGDIGMNAVEHVPERDLGDDERGDQPDQVGAEQRPPNEPASAVARATAGRLRAGAR